MLTGHIIRTMLVQVYFGIQHFNIIYVVLIKIVSRFFTEFQSMSRKRFLLQEETLEEPWS